MKLIIENKTVTMSNAGDENRDYTVRGEVSFGKDGFESISNGQVLGSADSARAWFGCGVTQPLSLNFGSADMTATEQTAIMSVIQEFIAAASANV